MCCFYLDTWDNGNTASRMLAVQHAVNDGTFCIDEGHEKTNDKSFINGHYYSDKAPLPTLLVIPFYKIAMMCGYAEDGNGHLIYILGSIICGAIPFSLILLLIVIAIPSRFSRDEEKQSPEASANLNKKRFSPALIMCAMFGSFIFIYAGTFYNHVLSGLFLLLAYIHLRKENYLLSGLFAGAGFLSEYIILVVIAIWGIQILINSKKFRNVILFGMGVLPSLLIIMIYNFIFTGSPFDMLYKFHNFEDLHTNYGFSHPTFESLWGLTFGQYKGLLFYTPVLILIFYLFLKQVFLQPFLSTAKNILRSYLGPITIAIILLVSSYFGWWGGWAYGPRLILFIVVLLLYEGFIYLQGKDLHMFSLWTLLLIGLGCAFAAKFTVLYSIPSESYFPFTDTIIPNIKAGNYNGNNILTMFGGVSAGSAAIVFVLLFVVSVIGLERYSRSIKNTLS